MQSKPFPALDIFLSADTINLLQLFENQLIYESGEKMEKYGTITFEKLSFIIFGDIIVKERDDGVYGKEIYSGSIGDLHSNNALHNRLDKMNVISIDAEGNVLMIGVTEVK